VSGFLHVSFLATNEQFFAVRRDLIAENPATIRFGSTERATPGLLPHCPASAQIMSIA